MCSFKKILIPVDFTINTELAVGKALALYEPGVTAIYLFHVIDQKAAVDPFHPEKQATLQHRLDAIKETLRRDGTQVETVIGNSSRVEPAVIRYANYLQPDLVIIGKNNQHSFFPFRNTVIPANIAGQTGIAVLTVKPGSQNREIETVVMPVRDFFPSRKIDLLVSLSKRLTLNVHLLTILANNQQPDNHSASVLLQSMRSVRSRLKCNVHQSVVHSDNTALATLRYAEKVNADIILVSPEMESTVSTWIHKKHISDLVNPASRLQVLSVQPK